MSGTNGTNGERVTLRDLMDLTNTVHDDIGELRTSMLSRFDSHSTRLRHVEEAAMDAKVAATVAKDIATIRNDDRIGKRWVVTTMIAAVTIIVGIVNWAVPAVIKLIDK